MPYLGFEIKTLGISPDGVPQGHRGFFVVFIASLRVLPVLLVGV